MFMDVLFMPRTRIMRKMDDSSRLVSVEGVKSPLSGSLIQASDCFWSETKTLEYTAQLEQYSKATNYGNNLKLQIRNTKKQEHLQLTSS